jgi:transcriptional regulator GlxA family with amidase domain
MVAPGKNLDFRIAVLLRQIGAEDCATASAKDWARRLQLSSSRFEHLFKDGTGISPSKYITQQRLQRARWLLETTNLSIKEVMFTSGITDRRIFNRQFRKRFGKTPTELRCANFSRKNLTISKKAS